MEKDSVLRIAQDKGYRPIYANLYPDGICRVWNISKIPEEEMGVIVKPIPETWVDTNSPVKDQKRYTLKNNQGKTYRRIWKH